jgi:CheY-like chemotaxis protein
MRPVNLEALLSGMRDLLVRTLGPSVAVVLELEAEPANVSGDETQIELAILNLAINARDAMPAGGRLTIRTRRYSGEGDSQLPAGGFIEIAVSDTGTGMSAEVAARAFDPFFTTKGVGKGTGLGLSQVYAMARQAEGSVRIQTSPGEGTTVTFYLPTTQAAAQPEASDRAVEPEQHAAATVLVIDDDGDVRRFLADSLDSFGYVVVQAKDGPSGLEALAQSKPDLVIVDYAMPGMTGAEVAEHIRRNHDGLPIVFASGYADTVAIEAVAEDSMVLRKPFRIDELQLAIQTALRR